MAVNREWSVLAAWLLTLAPIASMADQPVDMAPASALMNFERTRLPAGERMGLLGVAYVIELSPGWWVGPSLYGAATGRRGGLFTWGGEVQRRWRLSEHWGLAAGLYAGGGGGAAAPGRRGPHAAAPHRPDGRFRWLASRAGSLPCAIS